MDAEDRYALAAMDHPDIEVVAAAEQAPIGVAGAKRGRFDDEEGAALAGAAGSLKGASAAALDLGGPQDEAASGEGDEMAAMLGFSGFGGSKKR